MQIISYNCSWQIIIIYNLCGTVWFRDFAWILDVLFMRNKFLLFRLWDTNYVLEELYD
jgi:hypothetical protein